MLRKWFYIPELCFRYLPTENGSFVCCGTNMQCYSYGERFGLLQTFHHLEQTSPYCSGLLYLTDKYLDIKIRFFPGKQFTTDGVFYLATEPAEALGRVSCRSCSGEEQITSSYMNDLDTGYNRYLDSVLSEINYCTITSEEDSPEEHLMSCIRTVVKDYDSE